MTERKANTIPPVQQFATLPSRCSLKNQCCELKKKPQHVLYCVTTILDQNRSFSFPVWKVTSPAVWWFIFLLPQGWVLLITKVISGIIWLFFSCSCHLNAVQVCLVAENSFCVSRKNLFGAWNLFLPGRLQISVQYLAFYCILLKNDDFATDMLAMSDMQKMPVMLAKLLLKFTRVYR